MVTSTKKNSISVAKRAAEICSDLKGEDVVILNLTEANSLTDFFVIASGTSDTHVKAIAERVMDTLRLEGHRVSHVEGLQQGRWALLDYIDFVVHVFHPSLRNFYQLERLWGDAEVIHVQPDNVT